MLILLTLYFLFSCIGQSFINYLNPQSKKSSIVWILYALSGFQLINIFIVAIMDPTTILVFSYSLAYFLCLIIATGIYFGYWIWKFKNKINFELIKAFFIKYWLLWLAIFIFIFLTIFTRNYFTDTGYYIWISSQFNLNNVVPSFNDEYRYAASYYLYGAFSNEILGGVAVMYNLITPLCFFLVLIYYLDAWLNNIHNQNKYLWLIKACFYIGLVLFCIFLNPFIISGNLIIQSSLILLIVLALKLKFQKECWLLMLFSQFFSVTGIIVSIIIFIGLLIYYLIFRSIKIFVCESYTLFFSVSLVGVLLPAFFTSMTRNLSITLFFIVFSLVILCGIGLFCLSKFLQNNKFNNKFFNFNFCETKIFNNKIFFLSSLIISLVLMLITLVYFSTSYNSFRYSYMWLTLDILAICTYPIVAYLFYQKTYKNKQDDTYGLLFINIGVIFVAACLMWLTNTQQPSMWRITFASFYINFDGLNPLLLIILIYELVVTLFKSKYSINKNNILIKKFNNHKILLSSSLISSITMIFSTLLIVTNVANVPNKPLSSLFNKDVSNNLSIFDVSDINLLKNVNNQNWSYVTDNMAPMYLDNKIQNMTVDFVRTIYPNKSVDTRWWGYSRMNFFENQISFTNDVISLDQFKEQLNSALNNWITSDCFILSKQTPYYEYIKTIMPATYTVYNESNNLLIYSK